METKNHNFFADFVSEYILEKSMDIFKDSPLNKIYGNVLVLRSEQRGNPRGNPWISPLVLESTQFLRITFFVLFVLDRAQDFSRCPWTSPFFGRNLANPPKDMIKHHRLTMYRPRNTAFKLMLIRGRRTPSFMAYIFALTHT